MNREDLKDTYVYIAHPDYFDALCEELGQINASLGRLVFSTVNKANCVFAQDRWLNPQLKTISSINDAAKILQQEDCRWYSSIIRCARRSTLIAQKLRYFRNDAIDFFNSFYSFDQPAGVFSLLAEDTLLYSTQRQKLPPNGEYHFIEDKIGPPNRAYLKLMEALSILGKRPCVGDRAIDLGASPGGWTWVLAQCGAHVTAVDKAPLAPTITQSSRVTCLQQSAFSVEPKHINGDVDWLVCDVACYPKRLLQLIETWMASGKVKQFICTVKLQGNTNWEELAQFQAIKDSSLLHLFHNKHELTWLYPGINCSEALVVSN